jgi:hypothetical protein
MLGAFSTHLFAVIRNLGQILVEYQAVLAAQAGEFLASHPTDQR